MNDVNDGQQSGAIYEINVDVTAVLGIATIKVSNLLKLGRGAVILLERKVDEEIEIFANEIMIAKGDIIVNEDRLAVKLTRVIKSNLSKI